MASKTNTEKPEARLSPMPPRIDASPEEIARAVLSVPFKKNWRYLEEQNKKDSAQ